MAPTLTSDNGKVKSSAGVYVTGASPCRVEYCKFYNSLTAINVDDYQNLLIGNPLRFQCNYDDILNCYIQNCYRGIDYDFLGYGGGVDFIPGVIKNNTIVMTPPLIPGAVAIKIANAEVKRRLLIADNIITGRFQDGIGVIRGSKYTTINNNMIDSCANGITLYTVAGVQAVQNISVTNNHITNCSNAGLNCVASLNVAITNNQINFNKRGIWINSYSYNPQIKDNQINNNQLVGVLVDNSIGCGIISNDIWTNSTDTTTGTRAGINISGSIVTGLRIIGNNFDYAYSGSAALSTQLYAVKTNGTYYSYTNKASSGLVTNNHFGRAGLSNSMTELQGGLLYHTNLSSTGIKDAGETFDWNGRKIVANNATAAPATGTWKSEMQF